MNIAVVGAGYVGLVTAACFSRLGNRVTVIESDRERLAALRAGDCPLHEDGLPEMLGREFASGRLYVTSDYGEGVPCAEVVFIAVQTPAEPDGATDTSHVISAVESVSPHLKAEATLVIKSTVPPGTTDAIAERVPAGVCTVNNPEFLRQGSALADFLAPDRVVIGAPSDWAAESVRRLHEPLEAPIIITSRRSAELAKYASNVFLAMRISFINEVAELAEKTGADVNEVANIVGADSRIGPDYLRAGLGWGGSCFPKDVLAQMAMARRFGCHAPLARATYEINARQRERALQRLLSAAPDRSDPVVGVLGLAFKPGTGDLRGSPALEVIGRLVEAGCHVKAHDPVAAEEAARFLPNVGYCRSPYEAAAGADAMLLATEWDEYLSLDWLRVLDSMHGNMIVDGRNCLPGEELLSLGFDYRAFGLALESQQVGAERPPANREAVGARVRRRG